LPVTGKEYLTEVVTCGARMREEESRMNEVYALSKSQIVVSFTETEKKKNA
jgi:hypothetical protein